MKLSLTLTLSFATLSLVACKTTGFPAQTAETVHKVGAEQRVEISLSRGSFDVTEVKFHVDASKLPKHIIEAAKEHIPGGQIRDCEIEYHGSTVYYRVSVTRDGRIEEVMFTASGKPYRWEIEIEMSGVPEAIRDTAASSVAGINIDKVEKVLDGGKNLLEYHFKVSRDGKRYKTVISPMGKLIRVYREALAEIGVPVR